MRRLRELRRRRVMTMAELEDASGVAANTIWRLESRRTTDARPSTIRKLAKALGVEPGELVVVEDADDA